MIEFSSPSIGLNLSAYAELAELWEACSLCAGFCGVLRENFSSSGYQEVDKNILPALEAKASSGVLYHVLPTYCILYRFSLKVHYSFCKWK